MTRDSCCVLSMWFSHKTGFMLCSFLELFPCQRVHVLFFPKGFYMNQDSCCVLSRWFSHETGFMLCSFQVDFS